MVKRIFGMLLAAALLGALAVPAAAAANDGVIRVTVGRDDSGEVTLYKVGEFITGGFQLDDAYGGGTVTDLDSLSDELAAWLAQKAGVGTVQQARDGVCTFQGLSEGLYLVVQTRAAAGYEAFQPFLVSVPWDGNMWELDVKPILKEAQPPKTGDEAALVPAGVLLGFSAAGLLRMGRKKMASPGSRVMSG